MNKWSGFSLTPHLRICDGDEKEEQEFEVRHEGSNDSLFFIDPPSYHPSVWRYDNNLDHHHHEEQGPKLEDYLSNSHQAECPIHHNQTNVNCTTQYPNLDPNPSSDYGAFERVGSVSGFESWLREDTPTFPLSSTEEGGTSNSNNFSSEETDYNGSILSSLAMSHGACFDLINETNLSMWVEEEPVKVDEKRKILIGESQVKKQVPKKSVEN